MVRGGEYYINWQQDVLGKHIGSVVFPEKMEKVNIDVEKNVLYEGFQNI